MLKVLLVTSEAYPLMKTGGLGDVCGSLPLALNDLGCDVRLLMPAYGDTRKRALDARAVGEVKVAGAPNKVSILWTLLPDSAVPVWLLDCPPLYARDGNPYLAPDGTNWPDNAQRFALLARAAVEIARGRTDLGWTPDVVHCNDWQTGLVPALLHAEARRPATVFTIHNLAYQGLFPHEAFAALGLPASLWSPDALEFYNQVAFIKGGLIYADRITTVSPNYAREIQTPEFGCGLDGLLRQRAGALHGIVNGIDPREWDPTRDPHIAKPFSAASFADKAINKLALQREVNLPTGDERPLIGMVGRLVHQKGVDLVLEALPKLTSLPIQLVILGSGEAVYAHQLENWARRLPRQIAVRIGYDEGFAHRIEAGADMFLMPSRFEPCGLNQLYSLRYGTVPIVRSVGGLADTVVDATAQSLADGSATGVMIERDDAQAVVDAVQRALDLYHERERWNRVALTGMRQDHTWHNSARSYLKLYEDALRKRP
jgi:starch synthase